MPLRTFTDPDGNAWQVWDTRPTSPTIRPRFVLGWLTFEHGDERRRLVPIPDAWDRLSDDELRALCRQASPEQSRRPAQ